MLGGLALAGGAGLIAFNPAFTSDEIGTGSLLNALLPAYSCRRCWPGAMRLRVVPRRGLAGYAGAALFTWVTLEVRQGSAPAGCRSRTVLR